MERKPMTQPNPDSITEMVKLLKEACQDFGKTKKKTLGQRLGDIRYCAKMFLEAESSLLICPITGKQTDSLFDMVIEGYTISMGQETAQAYITGQLKLSVDGEGQVAIDGKVPAKKASPPKPPATNGQSKTNGQKAAVKEPAQEKTAFETDPEEKDHAREVEEPEGEKSEKVDVTQGTVSPEELDTDELDTEPLSPSEARTIAEKGKATADSLAKRLVPVLKVSEGLCVEMLELYEESDLAYDDLTGADLARLKVSRQTWVVEFIKGKVLENEASVATEEEKSRLVDPEKLIIENLIEIAEQAAVIANM